MADKHEFQRISIYGWKRTHGIKSPVSLLLFFISFSSFETIQRQIATHRSYPEWLLTRKVVTSKPLIRSVWASPRSRWNPLHFSILVCIQKEKKNMVTNNQFLGGRAFTFWPAYKQKLCIFFFFPKIRKNNKKNNNNKKKN